MMGVSALVKGVYRKGRNQKGIMVFKSSGRNGSAPSPRLNEAEMSSTHPTHVSRTMSSALLELRILHKGW